MPQKTQLLYDYKELAEILVKNSGIHSGHWMVFMRFGIGGSNIPVAPPTEDEEAKVVPAALVPVLELGIQKVPNPGPLSVDASEVNPRPKPKKRSGRKPVPKRKR